MSPAVTPRFSVIVPVLNLRNSLPLLLRCLEAQTFPRDRFECIFVDDGSTDGTRELLEGHSSPVDLRVFRNEIRHYADGEGAGVNT